ncbi:unnamed protein product [Schistosoma turkestanicum]|nr:unnamed protein product [Schistosoma turkestanicum]
MQFYLIVLLYCILQQFVYIHTNSGDVGTFYHTESFRKQKCVIFERPESCAKVIKNKSPLFTHFAVALELEEKELKNLLKANLSIAEKNRKFEYWAEKSCNIILQQLTTTEMPYYERPYCSVVRFIPSDVETVFALLDIVYDSIKATQLHDQTLLGTLRQNKRYHPDGNNLAELHVKIMSNTMKRTCEECKEICPPYSYCVNTMNGINCVCRFGWTKVGGFSRSQRCKLHPISVVLLVICGLLSITLFVLSGYFIKRITVTKYLRRTEITK